MMPEHSAHDRTRQRRWWFRWTSLQERLAHPGVHWVWVSIAMYVLSCCLPAMPPIFSGDPIYGFQCLISLMYMFPAWWANPTYFIALILYARRCHRAATGFAAIAAVLALSFEVLELFQNPGAITQIAGQEVGCYVWIASMQLLACNLLWQQWLEWQRQQERLERGPDESA
jgi:hypothetical protein